MKYGLLLFLTSCRGTAEENAERWVRELDKTSPIYHLSCEEEVDEDGRVSCSVAVESMHRLFSYQLKCYNSNRRLEAIRPRCIEALDD